MSKSNRRDFLRSAGLGSLPLATGRPALPDTAWEVNDSSPGGRKSSGAEIAVPLPPLPGSVERRGKLRITVGELRIIARGPMFPAPLVRFADDSLTLTMASSEEHSTRAYLRSPDRGATWKPFACDLTAGGPSALDLSNGTALGLHYDTKAMEGRPGWYKTTRWESSDHGLTARGPLEDGLLYLPPDRFDPKKIQWFHGNAIEMRNGDILAAMHGFERDRDGRPGQLEAYIAKSSDHGKNWEFLSAVASPDTIDDPEGRLKQGWTLCGPCEVCIAHVGGNRLVCVARMINDDHKPLIGPPMDAYHDLNYTLPGSVLNKFWNVGEADKYYSLGPPTLPLMIALSLDGGKTWTKPGLTRPARGVFPRMAFSDGILALSYGALAFPRWGHGITFSTDSGNTWTDELSYAPFFTTGYTDIIAIGPRKFLCVFDCTPPQPAVNHAAHWVGAVDFTVEFAK